MKKLFKWIIIILIILGTVTVTTTIAYKYSDKNDPDTDIVDQDDPDSGTDDSGSDDNDPDTSGDSGSDDSDPDTSGDSGSDDSDPDTSGEETECSHTYYNSEIIWTWSSDCSTCEASLTCDICGTVNVFEATVTSVTQSDSIVYTATITVDGNNYSTTKTISYM